MLGTAVELGVLAAVNRPFYALVLRREGPSRAAAAVGLHAIRHLALDRQPRIELTVLVI